MVDQPNLLRHNEYKINEHISICVPTVGEIFDYGDQKYFGISQSLTSTPFDLMVQLDDIGIDYEEVTEFQLFCMMFQSIVKQDDISLIFKGDIDFTQFQEAENTKTGERALWIKDTDISIDRLTQIQICNAIRAIHLWEYNDKKAGNAEAKAYLLERDRKRQKRAAKKPYRSFLEDTIVALVNTEEFKYDYNTVMDLSVYKLNVSLQQIQKKKQWEQLISGAYSGTVDLSKMNIDKLNWLSPVNDR